MTLLFVSSGQRAFWRTKEMSDNESIRMEIRINSTDYDSVEEAIENILEIYPWAVESEILENTRDPYQGGFRAYVNLKMKKRDKTSNMQEEVD